MNERVHRGEKIAEGPNFVDRRLGNGDAHFVLEGDRELDQIERVGGEIQRAGWLTPYTAQTIAEDAVRAGRGARLEVAVPSDLGDASLAELQDTFAWLGERGVQVSVRRDHHLGPVAQSVRPHAAA